MSKQEISEEKGRLLTEQIAGATHVDPRTVRERNRFEESVIEGRMFSKLIASVT